MKVKDFAKVYFAILLLHLVTLFKGDSGVLYWLSKPLIISSLLFYFLAWSTHVRVWVAIVLALVASLVGDVLLMFKDNDAYFSAALIAFASGELFYTVYHARFWDSSAAKWLLPGLLIGVTLTTAVFLLSPEAMAVTELHFYLGGAVLHLSLAGHNAFRGKRSMWCFWGALLYLFSDIFLVYNKFGPFSSYLIMLSTSLYAGAQFMIIYGILRSGLKTPRHGESAPVL